MTTKRWTPEQRNQPQHDKQAESATGGIYVIGSMAHRRPLASPETGTLDVPMTGRFVVGLSGNAAGDGLGHITPVRIGDVAFGLEKVPVIAGPCAVETDYVDHAIAAAEAGAAVLRGCVHKPRSRPDRFQGVGDAGLPLLAEAHKATGLAIVSEPLGVEDVERMFPYVHGFLVGTRSMYNSRLLQSVGRAGLPVILKRGFSATYEEWLGAADYIRAEGNSQVILCERGIRTFNTEVRNTLDISAIPVMRSMCGLPVIVDPSHAAGRREWVAPLAFAAVAAGADGLIIEAHPVPDESWTDSRQALHPRSLETIINSIGRWPPEFRAAGGRVLETAVVQADV